MRGLKSLSPLYGSYYSCIASCAPCQFFETICLTQYMATMTVAMYCVNQVISQTLVKLLSDNIMFSVKNFTRTFILVLYQLSEQKNGLSD